MILDLRVLSVKKIIKKILLYSVVNKELKKFNLSNRKEYSFYSKLQYINWDSNCFEYE